MPELPEVETTRRGIEPYILQHTIKAVTVRDSRLRWPVPSELAGLACDKRVTAVDRRSKYILLHLSDSHNSAGAVMIHLGMSGSLRIVNAHTPPAKHDHVDIEFNNGKMLRYTDPRRFGCVLWQDEPVSHHQLLAKLGPEPLSEQFDGELLFSRSRRRSVAVKTLIMDASVVVGVGNIYANEALFTAGIRPDREAGRISKKRYLQLVQCIKQVLAAAIKQGGTTLKDFVGSDGKPGYFKQQLNVYGRAGLPCRICQRRLVEIRLAQRSTVFCQSCQR